MSWSVKTMLEQKRNFIKEYLRRKLSISELSEDFGISRVTAHKTIKRFMCYGYEGLKAQSRAPHTIPHKTKERIVGKILSVKKSHKYWGAGKILGWLLDRNSGINFPSKSTTSEILNRHGFVQKRRKRYRNGSSKPILQPKAPNEVWSVDYKGEFRLGNGDYVYPLTITDQYSRYLLDIRGHHAISLEKTKESFKYVFRERGLPQMILSDNGPPFGAGNSIGRLTRLNAWWIQIGIRPVFIQPGHPEQNGKHERMHRELKLYTTKPPAYNHQGQQRKFNSFREEYNHERPHEGIENRTPASLYRNSIFQFPERILPPEYPDNYEIRKVSDNSGIKWKDQWVSVSTVLVGENIGFEEVDDGLWNVYYYHMKLGYFHERKLQIKDFRGRFKRSKL